MPIRRRDLMTGTIGMAALAGAARAADLPAGSVRIVVPAPPGAFNDALARLLADRLAPVIGHPAWWRTSPAPAVRSARAR